MIRVGLLLFLIPSLAACGSMSHPLPKCDGYSRRPMNRSMWQWQDNRSAEQPTTGAVSAQPLSQAVAYVEDSLPSAAPAAFAPFDIAGSYRPCEGR
ncbi:hypothetical protein [Rhizobium sp. CNPSo 3490]|uniref:hypothetical protein n=1 Tax=Rhizobium sp. CNPSo 3490 TaxID=3021407 RepID=UPI00255045E6|nr:hypothetical protein [Rhizobium sp. CNPSo 3490]MDK4732059.1 hypothetical protein [Rhizobium sp. CNPSo 3490]